jgi:hypothetical protein
VQELNRQHRPASRSAAQRSAAQHSTAQHSTAAQHSQVTQGEAAAPTHKGTTQWPRTALTRECQQTAAQHTARAEERMPTALCAAACVSRCASAGRPFVRGHETGMAGEVSTESSQLQDVVCVSTHPSVPPHSAPSGSHSHTRLVVKHGHLSHARHREC